MHSSFWWGPPVGMFWIFPLLCVIFMVAMVAMMLRRGGFGCMPKRRDRPSAARDTPRQILDRRLASGEITPEEHDTIGRHLEDSASAR